MIALLYDEEKKRNGGGTLMETVLNGHVLYWLME